MQNFDFDWLSADKLTLRGQCWLPDEAPLYMACLVHGFGEHSARYGHVAEYFTERQIGLIAYDQRGHGRSDGKRGVVPSYQALMDDVSSLLALCNNKFPGVPLVLYGHSMGGNLVLSYILRFQPAFLKGAVVTSPWLRLAFEPPALQQALGKLMSRMWPSLSQPAALDVTQLSSVQEVGRAYLADPLVHDKIGAGTFTWIAEAGRDALSLAGDLRTPLLLMHGDEDKITSCAASEEFARKAPVHLCTWQAWNGLRHEMHNEHNKEEVLNMISGWIRALR